ncbi:MAG: Na+/solute symporter [Proteobacteria bacterium]|nr:Na+/solute symporter [Pseudomonadota bacterium]
MIWLILYIALLFGIGFHHWLRHRGASLDGFVVYDRQAGGFSVGMSLVALAFGASSVFGLAGYAYQYNLNALWWTLSGAIFLVVLAYTFLDTVWRVKGYTIGDIIAQVFGDNIRLLVSAVLFLAWLMVLAGQIIAGGNILTQLLGSEPLGYALFTLIFAAYSLLVGQAGTVKTGFLQVTVMVAGLALLLTLSLAAPIGTEPRPPLNLRFGFDEAFTFSLFLGIFIPVGLSYLFGPDMYSRIFVARDIASARRGLLLASALIVAISLLIVFIGILAKGLITVAKPDLTIQTLVTQLFSGQLADFVLVALLSIPLSGADIILITTGTLLGRDVIAHGLRLLGRAPNDTAQVWIIRGCMMLAAVLATLFALRLKAIIPSLLIAYKVFSIGIVPLLFLSLLSIRQGATAMVGASTVNRRVAVYLLIASLGVLLVELKFIPLNLPHYNLYLLLGNTLLLALLLRLGGHRPLLFIRARGV